MKRVTPAGDWIFLNRNGSGDYRVVSTGGLVPGEIIEGSRVIIAAGESHDVAVDDQKLLAVRYQNIIGVKT